MNIFIVDDEPIAQDILKAYAGRVSYLNVVGTADNAIDGLEKIKAIKPDLVFLDIQMPELTGVEMLKSMKNRKAQVVITTAYRNYALEGYELDIVDYLVKPVPFERFLAAVDKAYKYYLLERNAISQEESNISIDSTKNQIWVKEGKKTIQIDKAKIVLAEAMADYVNLQLTDRRVTVHSTMIKMEELLPPPDFIRVSRSVILRMSAIKTIEDMQIETTLDHYDRISIGATYWDTVKSNIRLWTK